jgi:preprotein translocase subunit YajC
MDAPFIVFYVVLLVAAFIFFVVRPQRRQLAAHRAFVESLEVGDEVITAGGIIGTIRTLDEGTAHLEVAPGVVIEVARGAIAQRRQPETDDGPAEPPSAAADHPDDGAAGDVA